MDKKRIEEDKTIKKQAENVVIEVLVNSAYQNKEITISAPEQERIRKIREHEEGYESEKSITIFEEGLSSDTDLSDVSMVSVESDELNSDTHMQFIQNNNLEITNDQKVTRFTESDENELSKTVLSM